MLTKEKVFETLKNIGLNSNDTILIHSSLKSIGQIEGNAECLIDWLKEYFNQGLIIFPTHTWSFMNQDNQILNLDEANSCVGTLTNIVLNSGFVRSAHPTHSICAYGVNAMDYIKLDDYSNTPVNPNGCFGVLGDKNAKILFLGAKLSKNTFIHSIEERYNVSDRFTNKIYHFYSKKGDVLKEFYMPKHYSTLNPHISDNYLKLESPMIELGIAKYFKFGEANSIIVDASNCQKFVSYLLENNIHIFDDSNEIDKNLVEKYKNKEK